MKRTTWYSLVLFAVILAAWELIVWSKGIAPLILPKPSAILLNLSQNFSSGYFWPHLAATFIEILGGFMIGTLLGMGLGFVTSQSQKMKEILNPYIIASQAMPKLALAPLLVLWFGFGYLPKIVIVALVSFFPLFESTVAGLTYVEEEKILLFRSLRATPTQVLLKLRLPTAIPYLFSGLRMAMVQSVVGAVISEFIGANRGLGAVITAAQGMMDTPLIFSAFILLTVIAVFLYQSIHLFESVFLKKYYYARGRKD